MTPERINKTQREGGKTIKKDDDRLRTALSTEACSLVLTSLKKSRDSGGPEKKK